MVSANRDTVLGAAGSNRGLGEEERKRVELEIKRVGDERLRRGTEGGREGEGTHLLTAELPLSPAVLPPRARSVDAARTAAATAAAAALLPLPLRRGLVCLLLLPPPPARAAVPVPLAPRRGLFLAEARPAAAMAPASYPYVNMS
jgi:hypothetical protein